MTNENETKKCPQCQMNIPLRAKKCPHCQSDIGDWKSRRIGCGSVIAVLLIIIITYAIINAIVSGGKTTNPQETARKNAVKIYEQMIMDNAVTVIEKIPTYASNQRSVCPHESGFVIEDPYGAEWYVIGSEIFVVNGLAKSLTPDVDYAPAEISYQSCY